MTEIRWKVVDPLGNEIYLTEENFQYHIIGKHTSKDAVTREQLEKQVKNALQQPRFIVKDKNDATRKVYLDLCDVDNNTLISIRPLCVAVEENGEVVTWFATRAVNIKLKSKGEIFYDRRIHNLQI